MLKKLRFLFLGRMKYITLAVIGLIAGTLALAGMSDEPMFSTTPEEGEIPFEIRTGDAKMITGAVAGITTREDVKANITIKHVKVEGGNLKPIKVEVKNLGEQDIKPRIDIVIVKQPKVKDILCRKIFYESLLSPGDEFSTELEINCSFEKPGDYELSAILIDQNLNILKSDREYFTIREVCELISEVKNETT